MKLGLAYSNSATLLHNANDIGYINAKNSYQNNPAVYDQMFSKSKEDIKHWLHEIDIESVSTWYKTTSFEKMREAIRQSVNKVPNMRYFEINKSEIACVHNPTLYLGDFYYYLWYNLLEMAK